MLKKRRKEAGLTQSQLAERANVSLRNLQYWESGGVGRGSVESVKRIADVLGCTIEDLLGD